MIKYIVKSFILLVFCKTVFAQQATLTGPDVIHFDYPDNFKEQARFIKRGRETKSGYCEFITTLRAKPGESIIRHEIAYNPKKCQSLVVQGTRISENKKKHRRQKITVWKTFPLSTSLLCLPAHQYMPLYGHGMTIRYILMGTSKNTP